MYIANRMDFAMGGQKALFGLDNGHKKR